MEIMYSDWGLILGNYNLAIGNKINDQDLRLESGFGFGIVDQVLGIWMRDCGWGQGLGMGLGLKIGIRISDWNEDWDWNFGILIELYI